MDRKALSKDAVTLVESWLAEAASSKASSAAESRLAELLKDPNGLTFTLNFVDRVIRPESIVVAAKELRKLTRIIPKSLPLLDRLAIRLGGYLAPIFPFPIIPIARFVLRQLVSHLIADARSAKLTKHLKKVRAEGVRLNLNLLGEAVLGEAEAANRSSKTFELLRRNDVDYVSVKVSSVVSQLSMWGYEDSLKRVLNRIEPLYEFAKREKKFINLDMEEYRDLWLTIEVYKTLLSRPKFKNLETGIVIQAYLPDSYQALADLVAFAKKRVKSGGAPIKVRLVKGANLAMERVDASLHGFELATYDSKVASDANYKRLLEILFDPEVAKAVKTGVAGHNLFDIAYAYLLAKQNGVLDRVDFEMLKGMAVALSASVKKTVGSLLLYTPVVSPAEFEVAIAYLTRRLEENASPENFMSGVFELTKNRAIFERERDRFLASIRLIDKLGTEPNRIPNNSAEVLKLAAKGKFRNQPDSDPAIPEVRKEAAKIVKISGQIAKSLVKDPNSGLKLIETTSEIDKLIRNSIAASVNWSKDYKKRVALLMKAAAEIEKSRPELIAVMMAEAGKTIGEADVEVSEAVDFARYYAAQVSDLVTNKEAKFTPDKLTLVVPPWNFPVAIPIGGVLAALAAGSTVILKPAPEVRACAVAVSNCLYRAGIPKAVLKVVAVPDNEIGLHLVGHDSVNSVVLTGSFETAELFKSHKPNIRLAAETSGKNALVVTPFADLDLAAQDLAKSAFGHSGQKCSAASLAILVGPVYESEKFRRQLLDAVESMKVDWPENLAASIGAVISPPTGKLLRALTELEDGESWILEPKQLDESGRLWRPGIKIGVKPGSFFHLTEVFGPVLGIMRAKNLKEAIELQNAPEYGLTAGLHSLDESEIRLWLERVNCGNLYVNRGITGAIVERQPFGGFKRSAVGTGLKAGGSSYLTQFGSWSSPIPIQKLSDSKFLKLAKQSDQKWWGEHYGQITPNAKHLEVEGNYRKYLPANVQVRVSQNATKREVERVLLAIKSSGFDVPISADHSYKHLISHSNLVIETEAQFKKRIVDSPTLGLRIWLLGEEEAWVDLARTKPDIHLIKQEPLVCGRITGLNLVREQAISITQHRFGALIPKIIQGVTND
jgi:RHH-type transcriptional regulator, proline utilization regulon repressor / proline dehydrogenase / delta 1-pyrroline-5-carboxylate dehydrogenase